MADLRTREDVTAMIRALMRVPSPSSWLEGVPLDTTATYMADTIDQLLQLEDASANLRHRLRPEQPRLTVGESLQRYGHADMAERQVWVPKDPDELAAFLVKLAAAGGLDPDDLHRAASAWRARGGGVTDA